LVRARRRPRARVVACGRRCGAGRRRAALAGVRELRPVPQLRGTRRRVPPARGGAAVKQRTVERQLLVLVSCALTAFGIVMVYSATSARAALGNGNPMGYLERQGVYALIGFGLMIFVARWDYRKLRALAPTLVVSALGLCVVVLALGVPVNGARRWLG